MICAPSACEVRAALRCMSVIAIVLAIGWLSTVGAQGPPHQGIRSGRSTLDVVRQRSYSWLTPRCGPEPQASSNFRLSFPLFSQVVPDHCRARYSIESYYVSPHAMQDSELARYRLTKRLKPSRSRAISGSFSRRGITRSRIGVGLRFFSELP